MINLNGESIKNGEKNLCGHWEVGLFKNAQCSNQDGTSFPRTELWCSAPKKPLFCPQCDKQRDFCQREFSLTKPNSLLKKKFSKKLLVFGQKGLIKSWVVLGKGDGTPVSKKMHKSKKIRLKTFWWILNATFGIFIGGISTDWDFLDPKRNTNT